MFSQLHGALAFFNVKKVCLNIADHVRHVVAGALKALRSNIETPC